MKILNYAKTLAFGLALTAVFPLNAQEYLPQWKEGYLDLHTIATGRGDAMLYVMPDGTTMLCDAGDIGSQWHVPQMPDTLRTVGEWIVQYIRDFSKGLPHPDKVDYFYNTHLHSDHLGRVGNSIEGTHGFRLCGVTHVGDILQFGKIVDRDYPDYNFPSREKVRKELGFFDEYVKMIEWQKKTYGTKAEKFIIGSDKQFVMLNNPEPYKKIFKIQNIAANARCWTGKGLKSVEMYRSDPATFDENMNSCVITIQYGKFKYYNGGDLCGAKTVFKTPFRDFESQVAPLVGKVNVMKPDHHGWRDSSNPVFLSILKPEVIIVPSAAKDHPHKHTMQRFVDPLLNEETPRTYYITSEGPKQELGEKLWSYFKPYGHIVTRVYEGGTKYQMFVLDPWTRDYRIKYKSDIVEIK